MNHKLRQSLVSLIFPVLLLIQIQGFLCQLNNWQYETCGEAFRCANFNGLRYPFWGGDRSLSCGHPGFELDCRGDANVAVISINLIPYRVLGVEKTTQTLNVSRLDLLDDPCPRNPRNTTLDFNLFRFSSVSNDRNITLNYGCSVVSSNLPLALTDRTISCGATGENAGNFYCTRELSDSLRNYSIVCQSTIFVPVKQNDYLSLSALTPPPLTDALERGFSIEWSANDSQCKNCMKSGGVCGYNQDSNLFVCYCSDRPYNFTCNRKGKSSPNKVAVGIGLGIGCTVLAGLVLGCFLYFFNRRSKNRVAAKSVQHSSKEITSTPPSSQGLSTPRSTNFTKSIPSYPTSKSDLGNGRGSSYFGVHVFNFAELEDATYNFDPSRELGDGGFGTVYYGALADGRAVAVKRLYENNVKRVEQFMNEVEILTRLRHKNLVILYGCTSKSSRDLMLVYEYIPNGTVADHLHGNHAKSGLLSWPVRLNIAVETADAIAYLHRSDIIHRDVKTNNVLLDHDFHVKVADFGLSRLFPTDVTHVSTAPQGTPGYVDPEYYQCYQLTEKSDVYSFGVMLMELISSLHAVDTNRHRHDINLSNMAVNKIQNRLLHELVDPNLGFEMDSTTRRTITLVAELAFQCLQQERDMRPSMEDVLQNLKVIRNENLNSRMVDIVDDISGDDDSALLKGRVTPQSPESDTTRIWTSSSTAYSSV